MLYKQNLHTHTTYCDGKNTPEEIVKKAIELNFNSIGFSGHAFIKGIDCDWTMAEDNMSLYKKEICLLREKYVGKLNILCGLELDLNAPVDTDEYDYVIGSMHFIPINGELVECDTTAQNVEKIIQTHFSGNGIKYAEAYYKNLVEVFKKNKADIVGHFDLLTKHSERFNFFDEESFEYRSIAIEALRKISQRCDLFEINTGAIARGYRTTPYPAPFILQEIKRIGARVIISSDCHNKDMLDCGFADCIKILKAQNINEAFVLKNGNFVGQKI